MDAKYMFENENYSNDQTYIIIKGKLTGKTEELYYKIQLLDTEKKPYRIMRNWHYKVVIYKILQRECKREVLNLPNAKNPQNLPIISMPRYSRNLLLSPGTIYVLHSERLHFQAGTLKVSSSIHG